MLVVSYQKLKLNSLHDIVQNTDLVYYVSCTFIILLKWYDESRKKKLLAKYILSIINHWSLIVNSFIEVVTKGLFLNIMLTV